MLGPNWQQAAQQAEQQRRYRTNVNGQDFEFDFGEGGAGAPGGPSGFSDFFDMFFSGIGRRPDGAVARFRAARTRSRNDDRTWACATSTTAAPKSVSLQIEDVCPRCHGTGTESGRLCPQCHGTGHVLIHRRFEVTIPKGIGDGQRIRLAGQGGAGINGGPNGDLYLIVKLNDDPTYKRKGDDLYVDLPVSIYDLVLGGEVNVPTLSGQVAMTIPAGTQNNRLLRLSGRGMPRVKGRGHGRPIRAPDRPAAAEPLPTKRPSSSKNSHPSATAKRNVLCHPERSANRKEHR